ncbi:MAG TPA: S1C family serine protease, partial [Acidimicrobiales bacterium]|nr:S1C family serine protease [Acidimicrobiales bacterium]
QVTVTFADGRVVTGDVQGVDIDGDLAVVAADTAGTAALPWAEETPAVGTPVWAVTVPASGGTRVTMGAVSAVGRPFRGPAGRRIPASVEHTAPLARGSSGSPLVTADGRLVGLNTHRLGDGFYLALPAGPELREQIDRLGRGETTNRRRLGVALVPSHVGRRLRAAVGLPDRDGLLVRGVEDGSPAAGAGLRRGDLIVAAGGRAVANGDDLFAAIDAAGDTLALTVVRGSEEIELVAHFAPTPEGPPAA